MAVTTQNSTEYANQIADPVVRQAPSTIFGRVRYAKFTFTQSGAGDATSIANLVEMPAGLIEVLKIYISWSAYGASRTLDLGYAAHTDMDGDAVAADPDAFHANEDVSSAGTLLHEEQTSVESQDGWILTAQVNDATWPDAATLNGYVMFVAD